MFTFSGAELRNVILLTTVNWSQMQHLTTALKLNNTPVSTYFVQILKKQKQNLDNKRKFSVAFLKIMK